MELVQQPEVQDIYGHHTVFIGLYTGDKHMEDLLEEEMRLLMEVIDALDRDEFTFFAQPQCDISTGKVVGAESLVRWQHREMGLIASAGGRWCR